MKALVCTQFGPPDALTITDCPAPSAGAKQIVVRVRAAGVNFPDVLMVQGKYQVTPPLPFTPGKEIAGIVTQIGAGVTAFKVGDRVCAQIPHGGFAEEALVAVNHLVTRIPDGIDFVRAAAFPLAYSTSFHALKRGQLKSGETLLVLGASGGVGIAAVQLGKIMGARVIACASSEEKLELCRLHGADATINYETSNLRDAIKQSTGGRGVDVVVDPVGDRYSEPAVRGMAWNGRYCVIGFAAGEIPKIPLNLVLLKGCSIVGVAVNSNARNDPTEYRENFAQLMEWIANGKLEPVVTATYPLARAADALADAMARRIQGKVVVIPG